MVVRGKALKKTEEPALAIGVLKKSVDARVEKNIIPAPFEPTVVSRVSKSATPTVQNNNNNDLYDSHEGIYGKVCQKAEWIPQNAENSLKMSVQYTFENHRSSAPEAPMIIKSNLASRQTV